MYLYVCVYLLILYCSQEPFVDELFEGLRKLCQLLIVEPHKLRDIWDEGSLAKIDHTFLVQFVKLRADYRKSNIQSKLPVYSAQVKQWPPRSDIM